MDSIYLAVEDVVSAAVGRRLIREYTSFHLKTTFRKDGNGYLRTKLKNFCEIANRTPFLLITDLDRVACPPSLIKNWTNNNAFSVPEKMLFRIAVTEIESWLLADHEAMKLLLGSKAKLPHSPDVLDNPKKTLLQLAQSAPKKIRDDLIGDNKAMASQGLGYNARLSEFVNNSWSPERASLRSASLSRSLQRLKELNLLYSKHAGKEG